MMLASADCRRSCCHRRRWVRRKASAIGIRSPHVSAAPMCRELSA